MLLLVILYGDIQNDTGVMINSVELKSHIMRYDALKQHFYPVVKGQTVCYVEIILRFALNKRKKKDFNSDTLVFTVATF